MVHDKGHVCTCCLMQMSIHLDPAGSIWQHVIALGLPLMSPQENMGANLAEVVVAGLHTTDYYHYPNNDSQCESGTIFKLHFSCKRPWGAAPFSMVLVSQPFSPNDYFQREAPHGGFYPPCKHRADLELGLSCISMNFPIQIFKKTHLLHFAWIDSKRRILLHASLQGWLLCSPLAMLPHVCVSFRLYNFIDKIDVITEQQDPCSRYYPFLCGFFLKKSMGRGGARKQWLHN